MRVVTGESARRTSRHMGPVIITSSTTTTTFFNLPSLLLAMSYSSISHSFSTNTSSQNYVLFSSPVASLELSQFFFAFLLLCLVMEGGLVLLGGGSGSGGGGGGGSSGVSRNESAAASKVEVVSEACSYPAESELELGLGLSLGGGGSGGGATGKSKAGTSRGECARILTANDFPSVVPHRAHNGGLSSVAVSGTKRAAESVSHDGGSPTGVSQVVGWPPIRAYRMNSLVNQAKAPRAEEDHDRRTNGEKDKKPKDASKKKLYNGNKMGPAVTEKGHPGFIKVNMDGIPIGRKVDLNAHSCYETLAQALEDMFLRSVNSVVAEKEQVTKASRLLDGSSEFVLTYEDKEGDWMLVGDVPWRMFLSSVRRLRIMRTPEANGLAPRFHESNERQRIKPI